MSLFGIGIDVVENYRIAEAIERHGERFLERIFHPDETWLMSRNESGSFATIPSA